MLCDLFVTRDYINIVRVRLAISPVTMGINMRFILSVWLTLALIPSHCPVIFLFVTWSEDSEQGTVRVGFSTGCCLQTFNPSH